MPIKVVEQFSKLSSTALDLAVVQSGMTVTVKAGTFKVDGRTFVFDEDQSFTAVDRDEAAFVNANIVEDADGEVFVLVDEAINEEGQCAEGFDWKGSPYTVIWPIFWFKVPTGTTTLDDVVVHAAKVKAPLKPEREAVTEPRPGPDLEEE